VTIDQIASLCIAPRADYDHPASRPYTSQIVETVKTSFVVEVSNDDQRSKVGALNRRLGAGAGTLDSGGKAVRFQVRRKLGGAIHFRIK
jgi:hypothetical protein